MKNMKTTGRVLALALALVTLVALLASCGSQTATNNSTWTTADTDAVTYFARILPQNAEAREMFTAAARGYDMSAEGFNDADLPEPDPTGVSLDGAKAALNKVKPTDDASMLKFNEYCDALTAEQVSETVARMATEVDLNAKRGFIASILTGIGQFLRILTKLFGGSYVWALFLFAIVVEILLLPFAVKQQMNSIKQARLRPKEMAIRKKYAGRNDQTTQRKMNEEIQKLYQQEGFNPMGGCLPMLIQLPIILALYQIVIDPLQYVLGKASALSSALTTYCNTARAAGGLGMSLTSSRGTIEVLSNLGDGKLDGLQHFAYFSNAGECYTALTDNVTIPNFNLFGGNMGLTPQHPVRQFQGLLVACVHPHSDVRVLLCQHETDAETVFPARRGRSADRLLQQHHGCRHARDERVYRLHRAGRRGHLLDLQIHHHHAAPVHHV